MSNSQLPPDNDTEDMVAQTTEDFVDQVGVEAPPPQSGFRVLWQDVAVLLSLAKSNRGSAQEALRRAFVRAGMSLVEATIWHWKDTALYEDRLNAAANDDEPILSEGERAHLRNIVYILRDNGIIQERPAWNGLLADLRLALRAIAKVRGCASYESIASRFDFTAVNTAREVRNRITHPKVADDLLVRDEDVNTVKQALDTLHWAINELTPIMMNYSDGSTSLDPIPWNKFESIRVTHTTDDQDTDAKE